MGGYGSGGWNCRHRATVEQCLPITIRMLRDYGFTKVGTKGVLTWGDLSVELETVYDCLIDLRWKTGAGEKSFQRIGFQWLAHRRHFGGHQYYMVCHWCGKPRAALYLFRNRFMCRVCHELPYGSQREQEEWRMRRKVEKICKKLNSQFIYEQEDPPRCPKGMRRKTYDKLCRSFKGAASRMYTINAAQIARLELRFHRLR